jgi:hypothetical protein
MKLDLHKRSTTASHKRSLRVASREPYLLLCDGTRDMCPEQFIATQYCHVLSFSQRKQVTWIMLNRWYINKVWELYTVYDSNTEDEDKELAQPSSNHDGHWTTLVTSALCWVTWLELNYSQPNPHSQPCYIEVLWLVFAPSFMRKQTDCSNC